MPLEWRNALVTGVRSATTNTRIFDVRFPELHEFDFKPGQFITLDLPIHEQRNKRWRSYSIASAPDGQPRVELAISYLEGGLASRYFFEDVKEGTAFTFRGPAGVFVLPDEMESKEVFMICTGTGVAPFRSMLKHLSENPKNHKNIYLIFGCRTKADLLYAEELKSLEAKISNFQYLPITSREEIEGRQGYVHSIYEKLLEEKQNAHFMLCGWKVMIDEAKQRLLDLGYDRKSIHQELYG